MSSSGRPVSHRQNVKELDSMKESISDIINQLQDIDPARLSFSPFLDLDTQISLAPVSDSPESSVEELHSSSHSVSGSQRSLEPLPANSQHKNLAQSHQRPSNNNNVPKEPQSQQTDDHRPVPAVSSPVLTAHDPEAATENCLGSPTGPASQDDIPNGTDPPRWSPESTNLESTPADEGRPLISPPPESVELTLWTSDGPPETCEAPEEASNRGRGCCCRCCRCKCCQSGRVPAFFSVLASLLCAVGIIYALYFYVPIKPPRLPDVTSRIVFTLCCCAVASIPVLLAMLVGALCQFCAGSFDLQESFPTRRAVQQLFVTSSLELLLLYVLNLLIMASLMPPEYLKLVPVVAAMFVLGRLVYWVSLNVCSSWRGFGSGLTLFPLLAVVALNLFLMYNALNAKQPLSGS